MTDHKDARQLQAAIAAGVTGQEWVNAVEGLVAKMHQRIAELEAERQWQPIETAPMLSRAKGLILALPNGCVRAGYWGPAKYTTGDASLSLYDKSVDVDERQRVYLKDFGQVVYELDARLGQIEFPALVHSVAG